MTPSGGGGVAFGAHIGGFVAGLAPIPVFKRRNVRLLHRDRLDRHPLDLQIGQWLAEPARERTFAGEGTIEDRVFSVFPEVAALTERGAPNLSGGQRKMVAILRAMSLSPSLLLIDEAFEGLAPLVVNRFREAMVRIREMGIALLMAESNLSHAALVADRLYAIDRGEIIFEGNSEDALASEAIMKTLRG